jgi:hypothetical protein
MERKSIKRMCGVYSEKKIDPGDILSRKRMKFMNKQKD